MFFIIKNAERFLLSRRSQVSQRSSKPACDSQRFWGMDAAGNSRQVLPFDPCGAQTTGQTIPPQIRRSLQEHTILQCFFCMVRRWHPTPDLVLMNSRILRSRFSDTFRCTGNLLIARTSLPTYAQVWPHFSPAQDFKKIFKRSYT